MNRRGVVDVATRLAGWVPLWALPLFDRLELVAQVVQGRRWGSGSVETEVRAILPLLPESAVVFDVGANRGQWSQALKAAAGHRAIRLFAFEPSAAARARFADVPGAELVPCGLGERQEERTLYAPRAGSVFGSLHARTAATREFASSEDVSITTLEAFCGEREIGRIDLLKMDAEGHELFILRGAGPMLEEGRLPCIFFEYGEAHLDSGTRLKDFWDLLVPLGYDMWRIVPGGRLLRVSEYRPTLEGAGRANYVAQLSR